MASSNTEPFLWCSRSIHLFWFDWICLEQDIDSTPFVWTHWQSFFFFVSVVLFAVSFPRLMWVYYVDSRTIECYPSMFNVWSALRLEKITSLYPVHREINSFSSTSCSLDVTNLFFLVEAHSLTGIFDTVLVVLSSNFPFQSYFGILKIRIRHSLNHGKYCK